MQKTETLEIFYRDHYKKTPSQEELNFNILNYKDCLEEKVIKYRRRNYYKVTFLTGHYLLHYGDRSLEINGTLLAFFSPDIPYTVETLSVENKGCYFIFRESYFNDFYKGNISEISMFSGTVTPIYLLDTPGQEFVDIIMDKMSAEMNSNYAFKHDLIRGYITELIHFALKLQPKENIFKFTDAKSRVTDVFNELLDRQFPIESVDEPLQLKKASDFAKKMNIHINYLNRALRATTGKTTTEHISERIIREAIALLKHSGLNISDISFCLGFEDPSHFNHFFKKHTSQIPSAFRIQYHNLHKDGNKEL